MQVQLSKDSIVGQAYGKAPTGRPRRKEAHIERLRAYEASKQVTEREDAPAER